MEKEENFKSIYYKYLNSQCSEEEKSVLYRYFRTSNEQELLSFIRDELTKEDNANEASYKERIKLERLRNQIHVRIAEEDQGKTMKKRSVFYSGKYQVAATVLLFFCLVGGYFWFNQPAHQPHINEQTTYSSIGYLEGKAFLRLNTGEIIQLKKRKGGIRVQENQVAYRDGTLIVDQLPAGPLELIVPKGGQFQASLPDGSEVWLNASSQLKIYPHFMDKERRVSLTGEGFFDVKKAVHTERKLPFIVQTGDQKIEVLGTQFNVTAYQDEASIKTTLVQGKVKVTAFNDAKTAVLQPNEESLLQHKSFIVQQADTAKALAWKNGYFQFDGDHIRDIMLKISRWYDVDVVYTEPVTSEEFVGMVPVQKDLHQVLEMLSLTGNIQFKIENRKVTVSSKK